MEFTVEFYETAGGRSPMREFLLELKASDPDDFAAVAAGLEKLRHRQCHREPLTRALNGGLFELRHVGKANYQPCASNRLSRPAQWMKAWLLGYLSKPPQQSRALFWQLLRAS